MRIVIPFAALLATSAAHAQFFSVYGTLSPAFFSNVQTGSATAPASTATSQYPAFVTDGVGGGVTLNILPLGPIRLGVDVRGSTHPHSVGFDTAFVGLKITFKPPILSLKPYVQVSGGYIAVRTGNVSTVTNGASVTTFGGIYTSSYAAAEGLAGLDYRIYPHVDFRIVEIGVGKGINTGLSFTTTGTIPNITFVTVNTGIVIRF